MSNPIRDEWRSDDGSVRLILGDALVVLPLFEADTFDAIVTDPPYGLRFMGKRWDYDVPSVEVWAECLRVLKPGGHLLAFAGTRTQHRMACAIEDAGFEIRDMIAWVYGSGFPKSLDVSKAIDKAAGAEREVVGDKLDRAGYHLHGHNGGEAFGHGIASSTPETRLKAATITAPATAPATAAARQWAGWGTALKPAMEPITVARKPLTGTVADNVLAHGTGAINVDGCRVAGPGGMKWETPRGGIWSTDSDASARPVQNAQGRWPANLIHDGSDEVVGLFPQSTSTGGDGYKNSIFCGGKKTGGHGLGDSGSAARFFYCAKASGDDRGDDNKHPTVKNTELMRWLLRLVTPPDGLVLDCFLGSGSTAVAAYNEHFRIVGIEREREYWEIAVRRVRAELERLPLFEPTKPRQMDCLTSD